MRVIHISPTAFGAGGLFGGGERYPVELGRALARKIECRLVTFGSHATSHRVGELDLTVLEPLALLGGHPAHPVPRRLRTHLDGADIVHAHHLRAFPTRIAAIAARWKGQPSVVTDHGLGRGRGVISRSFARFLTVSRYSADTLRSPPEKTTVIYGGADPERFRPHSHDERSGVLFVGRLTPHKGVDRLIEALPSRATLTIVGTGGHDRQPPERDYPQHLARLADERDVRFVGPVTDADLENLYRSARVLVLPSVHETCYGKQVEISELLGLSLLEAMASGTPVIASRVGGVPEIVADAQTGFLVEPGDVRELRYRLEQLLGNVRVSTEMGANARQHVLERFTWDKCADRCLSAYEDLIGAV